MIIWKDSPVLESPKVMRSNTNSPSSEDRGSPKKKGGLMRANRRGWFRLSSAEMAVARDLFSTALTKEQSAAAWLGLPPPKTVSLDVFIDIAKTVFASANEEREVILPDDETMQVMLEEADQNKDGQVSEDEFYKFYSRVKRWMRDESKKAKILSATEVSRAKELFGAALEKDRSAKNWLGIEAPAPMVVARDVFEVLIHSLFTATNKDAESTGGLEIAVPTKESMDAMFDEADVNKDGTVDEGEFLKLYANLKDRGEVRRRAKRRAQAPQGVKVTTPNVASQLFTAASFAVEEAPGKTTEEILAEREKWSWAARARSGAARAKAAVNARKAEAEAAEKAAAEKAAAEAAESEAAAARKAANKAAKKAAKQAAAAEEAAAEAAAAAEAEVRKQALLNVNKRSRLSEQEVTRAKEMFSAAVDKQRIAVAWLGLPPPKTRTVTQYAFVEMVNDLLTANAPEDAHFELPDERIIEEVFVEADVNKDGEVDEDEFLELYSRIQSGLMEELQAKLRKPRYTREQLQRFGYKEEHIALFFDRHGL